MRMLELLLVINIIVAVAGSYLNFPGDQGGQLYNRSTTHKDLKRDVTNCWFRNESGEMRLMHCTKGSYCFALVQLTYVGNPRKKESKVSYQGCASPNEPVAKSVDNCTSSTCTAFESNLPPLGNQSISQKPYYCCCKGDLCNHRILFEPRENVSIPGSWKPIPSTPVMVKPIQDEDQPPLMLGIAAVTACIFTVVLVISLIAYCKWRRKNNVNDNSRRLIESEPNLDTVESCPLVPVFDLDNMSFGDVIHKGYHATVQLAEIENHKVAVKIFPPHSSLHWHTEKEIYQLLGSHPNILSLITGYQIKRDLGLHGFLVMEYYPRGSLADFLYETTLSWTHMIRLAYSLANAVAYIHAETNEYSGKDRTIVAHRDISSRNVLIKLDGTCVLADFEHALCIFGESPGRTPSALQVGSLQYISPELLAGTICWNDWGTALKQVDCYALGLVLWEMAVRCHDIVKPGLDVPCRMFPYQAELGSNITVETVKQYVHDNQSRPKFPSQWIENDFAVSYLKSIIEGCWDHEGEARLTALCVMNRIKQIQDLKSDENVILDGNLALDSGIFYRQDINNGEEGDGSLKLTGIHDESSPGPSSSLDTGYESSSHQVQLLHHDPRV